MSRDDFLTRLLMTDNEFAPFYESRYSIKQRYKSLILFPEDFPEHKLVFYTWRWEATRVAAGSRQKRNIPRDSLVYTKGDIYGDPYRIDVHNKERSSPNNSLMTEFSDTHFFTSKFDAMDFYNEACLGINY